MKDVTSDVMESLEQGEVIKYQYDTGGDRDVKGKGIVCKSNKGGIRVLPTGGRQKRINVIKLGTVVSTHRDGGAARLRKNLGEHPQIERTGELRDVEYVQGTGWVESE